MRRGNRRRVQPPYTENRTYGGADLQVCRAGIRAGVSHLIHKYVAQPLDIWYFTLSADGSEPELTPFLKTPFSEMYARLSLDGRYVAYSSNESRRPEVYVREFPSGSGKERVSANGGNWPLWSGDGRELFYTESDALMAVPVNTLPGSSAGASRTLFQPAVSRHGLCPHDVSPDGQRFIVAETVEAGTPPVIRVVENWYAEFRGRENEEKP